MVFYRLVTSESWIGIAVTNDVSAGLVSSVWEFGLSVTEAGSKSLSGNI